MKRKSLMGLMLLLSLFLSCQSVPPPVVERVRPVVVFPEFPAPDCRVTESGGVVSMPLEYWLAIVRYKIDVDAAQATYELGEAP